MKALLLGNSPALTHPSIDLGLIPRGKIIVFGANRLWHATKPEWQLILPDFLGMVDLGIEPEWIPPEGAIHGLLVPWGNRQSAAKNGTPCAYLHRKDLVERKKQELKTVEKPFPGRGDPYMDGQATPTFLAQFILEFDAFDQIGILGVDSTARVHLAEGGKTHWYGHNPKCGRSPTFHSKRSVSYKFWTRFKAHAEKLGLEVRNLSPFEKTPFDMAGIQRQGFQDWIEGQDP